MKLADFLGVRSFLGDDMFTAYNPNFSLKLETFELILYLNLLLLRKFEKILRISAGPLKIIDY